MNKKGMTLVETLIAVGVLLLIVAIVIPSFRRAREKTRVNTATSNLKTIYRAYQQYLMDSRTTPKTIDDLSGYVKVDNSFVYQLNPEYTGD